MQINLFYHCIKTEILEWIKNLSIILKYKKKGKKINFKFNEPLTNEINHFYKCIINKKIKCLTGKKT